MNADRFILFSISYYKSVNTARNITYIQRVIGSRNQPL
jgi:hypothetical protein